jgi:hypothetical protein
LSLNLKLRIERLKKVENGGATVSWVHGLPSQSKACRAATPTSTSPIIF